MGIHSRRFWWLSGLLALAMTLSGVGLVAAEASALPTAAQDAAPPAPTSRALTSPTYSVTVAARSCPTYGDIMANRARNNIMESLQNLGPNSNYTNGTAVNPTNETLPSANQGNCTALSGWNFALGTGIGAAATDPGGFGKLSQVSNPYSTVVQTQASVPELNSAGTPTGANISGATTVQLTAAQVQAATQRKLWIMGGVVGAPLNGRTDLAFGVLRCAIDNANADNVEWIGFPAGAVHVFCYAYYVSAAPSSATITIVKNVTGGSPASQSFNFGGNTSFNPGGAFSLKKGEQISFVRAVGQSWTVSESSLPAGYNFTDITCSGSPPQAVIDNPTRTVTITPTAAGQQFTCTFNNAVIPPAVSLDIWKITTGGVGGPFNFNIGPSIGTQSATTVSEGTGVKALGVNTSSLSAGAYTVAEQVPTSSAAGSWAATGVECYDNSGASVSTTGSAANFGINLAANTACYVTNTFSPQGKITVQAMQTGPGSFNSTSAQSTYIVSDPNGGSKVQTATNSGFNSFATAEPQGGADHTTDLSFQSYQITGIAPEDTDTGAWAVDSVTCNAGNPQIDASNLFVTLTLSPSDPAVTCNFVYRFIPASGSLTQVPNKCATPTHSPKVSGTATVITCRAKTNVGNVKWSVRCTARASSGRGDLRYCRAKYLKNGKVKITTYGERITVKLTGKVAGSGQYAPWSKTYKWKR